MQLAEILWCKTHGTNTANDAECRHTGYGLDCVVVDAVVYPADEIFVHTWRGKGSEVCAEPKNCSCGGDDSLGIPHLCLDEA